uniref:Uncharacterized protein n=1 Tax=Arundo donax TaxID=35708 RepID=A0A0A9CVH1_ARUDO
MGMENFYPGCILSWVLSYCSIRKEVLIHATSSPISIINAVLGYLDCLNPFHLHCLGQSPNLKLFCCFESLHILCCLVSVLLILIFIFIVLISLTFQPPKTVALTAFSSRISFSFHLYIFILLHCFGSLII